MTAEAPPSESSEITPTTAVTGQIVPLASEEANRIQSNWLFGDWQHTTEAGLAFLEKEPTEWAALLYVGASLYQLGRNDEAREKIRQAVANGCPRRLAGRVLAAGANDSVGRAYAAVGEHHNAVQCFNRSVEALGIGKTYPQLARARICENFAQAGVAAPWNMNLESLGGADELAGQLGAQSSTASGAGIGRHAKAWLDKVLTRTPLTRLCDASGSDKGFRKHLYTTVYEEFIQPGKVEALLEIGLFCHDDQKKAGFDYFASAPSLAMWAEYLPGARIYGFDIKDFSSAKGAWTRIIQGDQSNPEDLDKLHALDEQFDVIIDDGLHASRHQQVSISCLFELVKPGGLYIVEDLHYQPDKNDEELKTQEALRILRDSGKWVSSHASPAQRDHIEQSVEEILFFDSIKFPRKQSRNAIAIIRRKK